MKKYKFEGQIRFSHVKDINGVKTKNEYEMCWEIIDTDIKDVVNHGLYLINNTPHDDCNFEITIHDPETYAFNEYAPEYRKMSYSQIRNLPEYRYYRSEEFRKAYVEDLSHQSNFKDRIITLLKYCDQVGCQVLKDGTIIPSYQEGQGGVNRVCDGVLGGNFKFQVGDYVKANPNISVHHSVDDKAIYEVRALPNTAFTMLYPLSCDYGYILRRKTYKHGKNDGFDNDIITPGDDIMDQDLVLVARKDENGVYHWINEGEKV